MTRDEIRQKAREQHKHILLKLMPDLKPHEIEKLNNNAAAEIEEWAAFAESLLSGGAGASTLPRFTHEAAISAEVWDAMDSKQQRHWALSQCAAPPAASPHAQAQAIVDAITADMMAESLEERATSNERTNDDLR